MQEDFWNGVLWGMGFELVRKRKRLPKECPRCGHTRFVYDATRRTFRCEKYGKIIKTT